MSKNNLLKKEKAKANTHVNTHEGVTGKKIGFFRELYINKGLYTMLVPGLIYFCIFSYLPLIGLYFAFVNYDFMAGWFGLKSTFVGLENFVFFFTSDQWITITVNTLWLNFLFISTGLIVQIVLALCINELGGKMFKKSTQTVMFLPNFLSWTVISVFSLALFGSDGGFINNVLLFFNVDPIMFYQDPNVWPAILVILRIWKGAGFGTVIFLSTISGIDQEMYEAARIDGANRLKSMYYLTLPMLKPTIVMLLIMSMGSVFAGDFGMIYALIGDNPLLRPTTDVIDTFVYRALRVNNDIGMSSAVGLVQSALGFIMVMTTNAIARKIDKDTALF